MFFTVRAYRWSRTPVERITALGAAAVQICYLMQGYGDLGFGTWGPVSPLPRPMRWWARSASPTRLAGSVDRLEQDREA